MALFGAGRKRTGINAKARMLLGDGDPGAADAILAANARDWPSIRVILAPCDDNDLSALLTAVSRNCLGAYDWLRSAQGPAADDPLAVVLRGSATVSHAWRIRSAARAQHVTAERFARFHSLLREAEQHLYTAAELSPESAAPWSALVTSGRGLQIGLDAIRRRFEAATTRCPDHRIAHQQMLQALCKKWFGSHEQMHAFAEQAVQGPHYAALAHLVPSAHLEHWFDLGAGDERRAYMHQATVRDALMEAADLSIFQPDHRATSGLYYEANLFAMTLSLAGLPFEARRAFELTDGVVTRAPWEYGNSRDQVTLFTLWRAKAA